MAAAGTNEGGRNRAPDTAPERGRSVNPVSWLLLVPIAMCLAVPVYNRTEPTLGGIPFFYWGQLAIIPIGVLCTVLVYRRDRGARR